MIEVDEMNKAVSVVRVFLIRDDEVYLMLRNGLPVKSGAVLVRRWITPGGVVEKNETEVQAAIRETKEEVGIRISEKDLTAFFKIYDPEFNAEMVFFSCTKWQGSLKIKEEEKFDSAVWLPLSKVEEIDGEGSAHLGAMIKEAALKYLRASETIPKKDQFFSKWRA